MDEKNAQNDLRRQADRGRALLGPACPGSRRGEDARGALERAALEIVGERGYGSLTIADLVARGATNRARFYREFAGKEECFARAYEAGAEALSRRLLSACEEEGDWAEGMAAALIRLASFIDDEPVIAAGLLAEARGAGEMVSAKREEVLERLAGAIDRGRVLAPRSRAALPAATPRFLLGAIDAAAVMFLGGGHGASFAEQVPGLLYLAVDLYLGPGAASRAVRRLRRDL